MLRYRLRAYFTRRRGRLALCWLAALALAAILVLSAVDRYLDGILDSYLEVRVQALISQAVNHAVLAQFEADPGLYSGLVTLRRDGAGNITAIDTDMVRINLLKAQVARETLAALEQAESSSFSVPLGTLLGGNLLMGRGPELAMRIMPAGAANTAVASEFAAVGINQTRHRMTLEVQLDITIIRPGAAVTTACCQQVLLGETVIVGRVPDSYTYIDDTRDSGLDKILDHGLAG